MKVIGPILRALLMSLVAFLAGVASAQTPPKPVPQGQQPPQLAAQPGAQQSMPWFLEQMKPVEGGTKMFHYCAGIANSVFDQKPPPGYYEPDAQADRVHNKAVASGDPSFKGLAPHTLATEHQRYFEFLSRHEADLKKCGTDLGFFTKRMPVHVQMIHDALAASEGKISADDGQKIVGILMTYTSEQEDFIKAMANLANDKYVQGEMHEAIIHVVQETTPPPHTNH